MRVALRWAALLAVLVAATAQQGGDQDTGGQGGCGDHGSECEGCLASGCAWQPNTGGDCYSDCLIMDTSCYTGEPAACPQSEELCAGREIPDASFAHGPHDAPLERMHPPAPGPSANRRMFVFTA